MTWNLHWNSYLWLWVGADAMVPWVDRRALHALAMVYYSNGNSELRKGKAAWRSVQRKRDASLQEPLPGVPRACQPD